MTRRPWSFWAAAAALLLVLGGCFGLGSLSGADAVGLIASLRAGRSSLALAALVLLVSVPLGLALGSAAAAGPRLMDALLARMVELFGVLPSVITISIAARATTPFVACAVTLGLLRAVHVARLVRGVLLRLGAEPYALGARALGLGRRRLVLRHALPHLSDSVKLSAALTVAYVVATEAALGFLGLATPGEGATWGTLLGTELDSTGYAALALVAITCGASYWLARAMPPSSAGALQALADTMQKGR